MKRYLINLKDTEAVALMCIQPTMCPIEHALEVLEIAESDIESIEEIK